MSLFVQDWQTTAEAELKEGPKLVKEEEILLKSTPGLHI